MIKYDQEIVTANNTQTHTHKQDRQVRQVRQEARQKLCERVKVAQCARHSEWKLIIIDHKLLSSLFKLVF